MHTRCGLVGSHLEEETMALTSLAAELMHSLGVHDYRKYIPSLHCGSGVTDRLFAAMSDSHNFTIDTSRTYKGKRGKTLNPDFMFEIFGVYSGEEADVVRVRMINWVRDNLEEFEKATGLAMIGKELELESWITSMSSPKCVGDEFALFALCKLFHRHACIVNTSRLWHTCSVEGCPDEDAIKNRCDLRFIQLTHESFALLRPNPGTPGHALGSVIAAGSVVGMLREAAKSEQDSPEETVFPIVSLNVPYVATDGHEVNLPVQENVEDIVEIPDETMGNVSVFTDELQPLQNSLPDETPLSGVSAPVDDSLPDETPLNDDQVPVSVSPKTDEKPRDEHGVIPCKIVVRKLDKSDINLWKPKPSRCVRIPTVSNLDNPPEPPNNSTAAKSTTDGSATPSSTSNTDIPNGYRIVSGYGLRNRPKPTPRGRHGPSRVSKSNVTFKGVFSSEESSQDETQTALPDETPKIVKIRGLSEPSPYRIAAQQFISAQKHGLLPPPPNQSLPGVKLKSCSSSSEQDEAEGDSDSTIEYDPPKPDKDPDYTLPDETDVHHDDNEEPELKPVPKPRPKLKLVLGIKTYGIKKRKKPKYFAQNRKFKCVKCDKLFVSIEELNEHFIGNHRKLKCPDCSKTFTKPRSLTKHRYSHNVKQFSCKTCGKCFSFQSHLRTHEATHDEPKQFKCPNKNCFRGYSTESDLRKHVRTHSNTKQKCTHKGCIYSSKDPRNYKAHLISAHSKKLRFFCPHCNKGFHHNTQMQRHKNKCTKLKRSDSPTF